MKLCKSEGVWGNKKTYPCSRGTAYQACSAQDNEPKLTLETTFKAVKIVKLIVTQDLRTSKLHYAWLFVHKYVGSNHRIRTNMLVSDRVYPLPPPPLL